MAEVRGASPAPPLAPVGARGSGPSGLVALGVITAALVGLVGISLVGQTGGGRPGSQAALGGPTAAAAAVATASSTGTAVAAPSPTAPPEPPRGTPPPRVMVPVGPARVCPPGSTPDKPGPVAQARPPQSYAAPMAFDRQAGRIVVLATHEDSSSPETWTFDVCTNTWTQMHPSQEPAGPVQIVYDAKSDLTIALDSVRVWAYDLAANTWTAKGVAPLAPQGGSQPRLVYDPVSGLVVAQAFASSSETEPPSALWTYDVETDTWFPFRRAGAPAVGLFGLLAYDASVDRIIEYASIPSVTDVPYRTRLFDIRTGTWSRSGVVAPAVGFGWGPSGGEIAYDEAMERTIVFSGGEVIAYDAAADRWEILVEGFVPGQSGAWPTGPTARLGPSMVYDPVNGRLVVFGGQYRTSSGDSYTWVQADDVLAFDPATRQWTVLLEAGEVRPMPS